MFCKLKFNTSDKKDWPCPHLSINLPDPDFGSPVAFLSRLTLFRLVVARQHQTNSEFHRNPDPTADADKRDKTRQFLLTSLQQFGRRIFFCFVSTLILSQLGVTANRLSCTHFRKQEAASGQHLTLSDKRSHSSITTSFTTTKKTPSSLRFTPPPAAVTTFDITYVNHPTEQRIRGPQNPSGGRKSALGNNNEMSQSANMHLCISFSAVTGRLRRLIGKPKAAEKSRLQISAPFNFKHETGASLPGFSEDEIAILKEKAAASRLGVMSDASPNAASSNTTIPRRAPAPPPPPTTQVRTVTPVVKVIPSTPVTPADNVI